MHSALLLSLVALAAANDLRLAEETSASIDSVHTERPELRAAAEGRLYERASWGALLDQTDGHLQGGVDALSVDGLGWVGDGELEFSAYRGGELVGGVTVEADGDVLIFGDIERFEPMRFGEPDAAPRYLVEVEAEGVRYYLFAD